MKTKKLNSLRNPKGSSLADLIASLALFGILLSISIPSLSELKRNFALRKSAESFALDLERFLLRAKKSSETINLEINKNLYSFKDSSAQLLEEIKLPVEVNFSTSTTNKKYNFYASGVASPATFNLENSKSTCAVVLSLRGRTQINC